MESLKYARRDGETDVGLGAEQIVPVFVPVAGRTGAEVARANGLRLLGRRETGAVVCAIDCGTGVPARAVVAS